MKKSSLFLPLLLAVTLLLCACTDAGGEESLASHIVPYLEDMASSSARASSVPSAGTVENMQYRSDFLGLCFSMDESWSVLSRERIASELGYGADYAAAEMPDCFSLYDTYVDLWAEKDAGRVRVQIMVEKLPITSSSGEALGSPAEYMDYMSLSLPETYRSFGLSVEHGLRGSRTVAGMPFECYSCFTPELNRMTQFMMTSEKNSYFLTVYITCTGADQTDEVLDLFTEY